MIEKLLERLIYFLEGIKIFFEWLLSTIFAAVIWFVIFYIFGSFATWNWVIADPITIMGKWYSISRFIYLFIIILTSIGILDELGD